MNPSRSLILSRLFRSLIWVVLLLATAWLINRFYEKPAPNTIVMRGHTMGSDYVVSIVDEDQRGAEILNLQSDVERLLKDINHLISTYEEDSWVSQFNAAESTDWYPANQAVVELATKARRLSVLSDGTYDITVGPLVDAWGFGPRKKPETIPTAGMIAALLERVGYEKLEIRAEPPALRKQVPGLRLDFSSIGQGYAVDRMAELLMRRGCKRFRINLSGEIYAKGKAADGKAWPIRIETPRDDRSATFEIVRIADQAFATSGDYRNFIVGEDGRRYSHTLDAKTGRPVRHALASASIVADECTLADGIATLMMAVGPERALQLAERENWKVLLIIRRGDQFQAVRSKRMDR